MQCLIFVYFFPVISPFEACRNLGLNIVKVRYNLVILYFRLTSRQFNTYPLFLKQQLLFTFRSLIFLWNFALSFQICFPNLLLENLDCAIFKFTFGLSVLLKNFFGLLVCIMSFGPNFFEAKSTNLLRWFLLRQSFLDLKLQTFKVLLHSVFNICLRSVQSFFNFRCDTCLRNWDV